MLRRPPSSGLGSDKLFQAAIDMPQERRDAFLADMRRWLAEGAVRNRETIVDGLERAPDAFLGLFEGANIGKMIVRL